MYNKSENISASEINKFIYCPYKWYYERFYGQKKILEILKSKREKKIKWQNYDASENKFAKGNYFHKTFRKKYLFERKKKIFLFFVLAIGILSCLFFWDINFVIFLGLVLLIKIFFVRNIKKTNIKFPYWPWVLIYSDERNKKQNNTIKTKVLFDKKNKLCGKPDLIYQNLLTKNIIPIELKSGQVGNYKKPKPGDLFQVIAYFIILESCFKKKPRYGYLIYSDYMFMIPNKRYLRKKVLKALKDMRLMLKGKFISHEKNLSACKKCICNNSVCKI